MNIERYWQVVIRRPERRQTMGRPGSGNSFNIDLMATWLEMADVERNCVGGRGVVGGRHCKGGAKTPWVSIAMEVH